MYEWGTMGLKEEIVIPLQGQLEVFYRRADTKQFLEGQLGINPADQGELRPVVYSMVDTRYYCKR